MEGDEPVYARLFGRAPLYDRIFSSLSPRSLIRVAVTCRPAHFAVAEYKSRAFSINRHFSHYFANPISFRSLQARTNTLVSGSNALQFLDRTFYPESDLDLYTHPGHSLEVAQFLVETEGYRYAPRRRQRKDWKVAISSYHDPTQRRMIPRKELDQAYPIPDIRAVWTFEKKKKTGTYRERLTVQIVEARSSPLECILNFHSTCVMNFITSDAACSLYPVATVEERSSLGMPNSRSSPEAVQKYATRGWRVYFKPTPDDPAFYLEEERWVRDRHTWIVPLDQTGVAQRPPLSWSSATLTCDPAFFNGWKVTLPEDPEMGESYYCHYYLVRTTLFRYNYATADEASQLAIRDWAVTQGTFSHSQISKEDWTWFDADVERFLQK